MSHMEEAIEKHKLDRNGALVYLVAAISTAIDCETEQPDNKVNTVRNLINDYLQVFKPR